MRSTTRHDCLLNFSCLISWCIALMFSVSVAADPLEALLGFWVMPDGSAVVEVYQETNTQPTNEDVRIAVRIAALRDPIFTPADHDQLNDGAQLGESRRDHLNPDESLRQRPLVGLTIVSGLGFKNGAWQGGRIYDPGSGRWYRCKLELVGDDYLRVRGYVGMALLGKTLYWQRAELFRQRVGQMFVSLDSNEPVLASDTASTTDTP